MDIINSIFNSSTEDSGAEELDEKLSQVHGLLRKLAEKLEETRYKAADRNDIARAQIDILKATDKVLDNKTNIIYTPPREDPTTAELAKNLINLKRVLQIDNLQAGVSVSELEEIISGIASTREAMQETDEFKYAIEEKAVQNEYTRPVQSIGTRTDIDPDSLDDGDDGEEIFAGPRARQQLEEIPKSDNVSKPPLFVGTGTRSGRDATIDRDTLFRHRSIFGVTGYGKSTLLTNDFRQLAEAGVGGCFIDPKGDDSERLIEILPDHRLDDIIWLEPGSSRDYVSGFNFISVGLPEDNAHYDTALSSLVHDLVKLLGAGKYWGPRMDRITQNLIRAMDTFNREEPQYPDLNLADLYYILGEEQSRIEFASRVNFENIDFIEDYTAKIGEMEDDIVEPVLGRLQPWIENPTVRRMIAFRESEVNIQKAVEGGKLLIVRMGAQPPEIKRMIGMAVVRRIWSVIRARSEEEQRERDPYFLFADEFDNLAKTSDEAIPTMLSESRSYRLSLNLCCQYPEQISDDILEGMMTNSDTILSFNAGSKNQARHIAPQLDIDTQTLLNEVPYHIWMKRKLEGSMEESEAHQVYTHPPFPPIRDKHDRDRLIKQSLQEHGRERRSDQEIKDDLLFYGGNGRLETGIGGYVLEQPDPELVQMAYEQAIRDGPYQMTGLSPLEQKIAASDELELPENVKEAVSTSSTDDSGTGTGGEDGEEVKDEAGQMIDEYARDILTGIWAVRLQTGRDPGVSVPYSEIKQEINRRLGDAKYETQLSNVLEKLATGTKYAYQERRSGEPHIGLTQEAMGIIKAQDTGSGGSAGKMKHRGVLRQWRIVGTTLGYDTWFPSQDQEDRIDVDVDGVSESLIDPTNIDTDGLGPDEIIEAVEERREFIQEEYPGVAALSDGKDVYVEAETSTPNGPYQPLRNLRKAVDNDALCIFATKDDSQQDNSHGIEYWARKLENILYNTESEGRGQDVPQRDEGLIFASETHDDGSRIPYNDAGHYTMGEQFKAVRATPNPQIGVEWKEHPDGTVTVTDKNHGDHDDYNKPDEPDPLAVFNSAEQVHRADPDARTRFQAYRTYDDESGVYTVHKSDGTEETYASEDQLKEDWSYVRNPYFPEFEYDTPLEEIDESDFQIVIFPDGDNPDYEQPQLYDQGELKPLYDTFGVPVPTTWGDVRGQQRDEVEPDDDTGDTLTETEPNSDGQTEAQEPATDSTNGDADTTPTAETVGKKFESTMGNPVHAIDADDTSSGIDTRCQKCGADEWYIEEKFEHLACGECDWIPKQNRRDELIHALYGDEDTPLTNTGSDSGPVEETTDDQELGHDQEEQDDQEAALDQEEQNDTQAESEQDIRNMIDKHRLSDTTPESARSHPADYMSSPDRDETSPITQKPHPSDYMESSETDSNDESNPDAEESDTDAQTDTPTDEDTGDESTEEITQSDDGQPAPNSVADIRPEKWVAHSRHSSMALPPRAAIQFARIAGQLTLAEAASHFDPEHLAQIESDATTTPHSEEQSEDESADQTGSHTDSGATGQSEQDDADESPDPSEVAGKFEGQF